MNRQRHMNGLVGVTVVIREDLRPGPPWSDAILRRFDRLVEDILDSVEVTVGPHPHWNHLGCFIDPWVGAFTLSARVSFLDELIKQPEVAECIDALDSIDLPETKAKGLD